VTLDGAGEALADGRALHVDRLADSEQAHRQRGTGLVFGGDFGRDAELAQHLSGHHTRLGQVASFGLGDAGRLARPEGHLNGTVAVNAFGLDLGDAVVGHIEHSHGNGITVIREDAHHAHLAAQQSETMAQTHGFSPAAPRKACNCSSCTLRRNRSFSY
jgi:hypothetical protein